MVENGSSSINMKNCNIFCYIFRVWITLYHRSFRFFVCEYVPKYAITNILLLIFGVLGSQNSKQIALAQEIWKNTPISLPSSIFWISWSHRTIAFFWLNIDPVTKISISHYSDLVYWWPHNRNKMALASWIWRILTNFLP